MITLNESSNWIAQHSIAISLIAFILLALSASTILALVYQGYMNRSMGGGTDKSKSLGRLLLTSAAGVIFLVSISLGVLTMSLGEARYSGSADYTIDQVKTQSSGQKTIMVNDGKSDVELEVDGKTSYAKGDKVNVEIQSYDSSTHGKHYLGHIIRDTADKIVIIETEYTLKKID